LKVTVSAPGKVVILGEYAVLEGAPALVMAVDRRARASLAAAPGPHSSVRAPGWCAGRRRFRLGDAGPVWLDDTGDRLGLVEHVLRRFAAQRRESGAGGPFDLVLDSSELTRAADGGTVKLGLGSSAALTVALYCALDYYAAPRPAAPPELEQLIDIHCGLQGRRGSGLDVAASLHGGLIEYTRSPQPAAAATRLPAALEYCFIWSGRPAATGDFLAVLAAWRRARPEQFESLIRPLVALAEGGARAARGGDAGGFLAGVEAYTDALEALGRAGGADILSRPHRRLRRLAAHCGVVYKPCGAGGGDVGIALSADPERLEQFRQRTAAEGFRLLALSMDPGGVNTSPDS